MRVLNTIVCTSSTSPRPLELLATELLLAALLETAALLELAALFEPAARTVACLPFACFAGIRLPVPLAVGC